MRRRTSRLLSTLLALCMALALLPGTACAVETSGHCGDHVTWSYRDGTLSILGTGPMENYHDHKGHHSSAPLWGSSRWEHHDHMNHAIIGEGVTSIGSGAFEMCGSLTGVTIPGSVTSIEAFAFHECNSLTDIYYGGSENQWELITIDNSDDGNAPLLGSTIHFNSPIPAVSATVNGNAVTWTDAMPFIDANGRTMVPLRAVAVAMGLDVTWDETAREASFTNGSKTISFPIDSTLARVSDGKPIKMDTAAIIQDGRTYAPIRYLAEYFDYFVEWYPESLLVVIT